MFRILLVLPLAVCCGGCTSLGLSALSFGKPRFAEASPSNPVSEIVCLWEPGEGRGLDNLPSRGFAGQLLFFTPGNPQPAKVNGDIRIYVFDDVGTIEEQAKPIYQFDSVDGAWNSYLSEANIGASYQIFIPYTRKGAYAANCSLRVRYTPAEGGPPVYSRIATVALPGRRREETAEPKPQQMHSPVAAGLPARTLDTAEIRRQASIDLRSLSEALSEAAGSTEAGAVSQASLQQTADRDASRTLRSAQASPDRPAAEPARLAIPTDAEPLDDDEAEPPRRYRLSR
jgi:hypothetical protein